MRDKELTFRDYQAMMIDRSDAVSRIKITVGTFLETFGTKLSVQCATITLLSIFGIEDVPLSQSALYRDADIFCETVDRLTEQNTYEVIAPSSPTEFICELEDHLAIGAILITDDSSGKEAEHAFAIVPLWHPEETPRGVEIWRRYQVINVGHDPIIYTVNEAAELGSLYAQASFQYSNPNLLSSRQIIVLKRSEGVEEVNLD